MFEKISGILPFRLAVNPSERVVREQLQQFEVAVNNQSLQDLIVDIISHLPTADQLADSSTNGDQSEHHPNVLEMIPHLFDGTFGEAVEYCKNNDKLLLVYLHSSGHDDSYEFIQNIFCKHEFIEFINANFVVYANSIKTSEGYSVSNQLQALSYPFLAILMGTKLYWKMNGLEDLRFWIQQSSPTGEIHQIDALLTRLIEEHEKLDAQLVIQRSEKQQREFERRAREEQDRAYEESLRKDREKEEKKLREERERQELINQFKRKIQINEHSRKLIRENMVFYNNEQNCKTIKFKLPNGTEALQKFSLGLTFADLHRFIHAYSGQWTPSIYSKLDTDYELTLNALPKKVLPFSSSETLDSLEGRALLIIVREAEHDEDEKFAQEHSL